MCREKLLSGEEGQRVYVNICTYTENMYKIVMAADNFFMNVHNASTDKKFTMFLCIHTSVCLNLYVSFNASLIIIVY